MNPLQEVFGGVQQRVTTLYLTLCVIRDRLEKLQQQAGRSSELSGTLAVLSSQLEGVELLPSGHGSHRLKLALQYRDSGAILEAITKGKEISGEKTRSIQNIKAACECVSEFISGSLCDDPSEIRKFFGYLTSNVKLIRIQTENVAKALRIFETINERGVGLNAMDLLKNLLFINTPPRSYGNLTERWKTLQDMIYRKKEKPLRFLRYFIIAKFDVDANEGLRDDGIYQWLVDHEDEIRYNDEPIRFVDDLIDTARTYFYFRDGRDRTGNKNRYLDNMLCLGGKSARQHLVLLLSGARLPAHLFDCLAGEIENLFFCYVISREAMHTFERKVALWAPKLRMIETEDEFQHFVAEHFDQEKAGLAARFTESMTRLKRNDLPRYRFRYLLAKLTQYIDILAYGRNESTNCLRTYMEGKSYNIEHIFPQNANSKAVKEFGDGSDNPEIIEKLGNLVLLEKSINSALSNRPYSERRQIYRESKLLLTRILAGPIEVGVHTRIDQVAEQLNLYDEWNCQTIEVRQQELVALARRVWDIPED